MKGSGRERGLKMNRKGHSDDSTTLGRAPVALAPSDRGECQVGLVPPEAACEFSTKDVAYLGGPRCGSESPEPSERAAGRGGDLAHGARDLRSRRSSGRGSGALP